MRKFLMSATAAMIVLAAGGAKADMLRLDAGQLDGVTAGSAHYGFTAFQIGVFKQVDIRENLNKKIDVNVHSKPRLKGNVAEAEAAADAKGRHTFTNAVAFMNAVAGKGSSSYAGGIAAASNHGYGGHKKHGKRH